MKRIEDLQTHGLRFMQDTDLFLFGTDAVELANFAAPAAGTTVCDLGAGSGIVSVLLAGKYGAVVTAVEIQEKCCALARENAQLNGLDIAVMHMPMQEFRGRFDIVVCNPPYRRIGSGETQLAQNIALCRHEIAITLQQVIETASQTLNNRGTFYLVHQAERIAEITAICYNNQLAVKEIVPVCPRQGREPNLVLVRAVKCGGWDCKLRLPIYVDG